eukprot:NODE_17285_length_951_cov_5.173544.p1 GENE.NODE_17285_length_951_cov_5.173544~~NODE_17285_length_951_cov_5.173544.p1  ORF type:complete len:308 (+),score=55.70 NODE_17285_length_951_cov_5.173544:135-926(+)
MTMAAVMIAVVCWVNRRSGRCARPQSPPGRWPGGGRAMTARRLVCAAVIGATLVWGWFDSNHINICTSEKSCVQFTGWVQLSTLTRWSWVLLGIYFLLATAASSAPLPLAAKLVRPTHVIYQLMLVTGPFITIVVYTVLVPSQFFRKAQPYEQGAIHLINSGPTNVLHTCNTVFILAEAHALHGAVRMEPADAPYGQYYLFLYFLFEVWFEWKTGVFHYPFTDYRKPTAEVSGFLLLALYAGLWYGTCALMKRLTAKGGRELD